MTSPPKIVKKKDGVIRQLRENTFLGFYELDSGDRIALTRIMKKILGGGILDKIFWNKHVFL